MAQKNRNFYAITPRFAITSSPEQLKLAGELVENNPSCYIQTHLSENRDEIEYTLSLYLITGIIWIFICKMEL